MHGARDNTHLLANQPMQLRKGLREPRADHALHTLLLFVFIILLFALFLLHAHDCDIQGVHFFFHAAVAGGGGRQTAPRTGTFLELKRRQVVARRWNPTTEDLEPADDVQAALCENRRGERVFVYLFCLYAEAQLCVHLSQLCVLSSARAALSLTVRSSALAPQRSAGTRPLPWSVSL